MNSQHNPSRRDFLRSTALVSALATAPSLIASRAPAAGDDQPILVLLQLSGGNDGLNTLVPFGDDNYYKARPNLAIKPSALLKAVSGRFKDHFGFHHSLRPLMGMWEKGQMAVVHGVGHPELSHRHFRAVETWHTAMKGGGDIVPGWIGRYFDNAPPAAGVSIGSEMPQMLKNSELARTSQAAFLSGESHEGLVGRTDRDVVIEAESMRKLADRAKQPGAVYADAPAARGLQTIATMIAGGLGARVYHHEISGFDTHAHQLVSHARLWSEVSDGVRSFFDDLSSRGMAERVVVLGFSEFGRRLEENNSEGTDHGSAAPVFLWGPRVRGGLHGQPPSLAQLEEGDLKFTVDLRSVYATILDNWLGSDHRSILGGSFAKQALLA